MKGSLIVVGFFILGLVAGRMDALPAWMAEGGLSFVALCGLLPQIRDISKAVPTEIFAYGRLPLMLTEHCLIRWPRF